MKKTTSTTEGMAEQLITTFMNNRSENCMQLDGKVDFKAFAGLWIYYRDKYDDIDPRIPFTPEELEHAELCYRNYPQEFEFMRPLFAAITSGKGNEGVGMLCPCGPIIDAIIIIRNGPNEYWTMEFEFNNTAGHPDATILVCSGT
jgi:hypothetical protein